MEPLRGCISEMGARSVPAVRLSGRELDVIQLVALGHPSRMVGDILFISIRTVEFHLSSIYGKLQVKNKVMAVRVAENLGLLPMEPTSRGSWTVF